MKGIVFNLLEQAVGDAHGPDAWDGLLEAAGLDGGYTSLGSYPDAEMTALVAAAAAALALPPAAVLRWFGRAAMPLLAARFPQFFAPHACARDFLLSLNGIIHPEVRKLYAGAGCPHFAFEQPAPDVLVLAYHSPRGLNDFALGLAEGAVAHWRERATLSQPPAPAGAAGHRLRLEWIS